MMWTRLVMTALAVLVLIPSASWDDPSVSAAAAQPAPWAEPTPRPRGRLAQRAPRPQRPNKREKVKQRIRAMRAWVLTEQLDLDAATAEKMFPVLARHDDELARLLAERKQLRAQLAAARNAGQDGPAISGLLDKLVANQRARWNAEDQRFADLRTILTPEQAAELLDLLPEVDRKILRELKQAVDRAPARRPASDAPDERGPRTRDDDVVNPFDSRR